jgi:3-hydroxyisobutyrate dehydrogenase-like beta-hydroxyacid dehydrogenase
MEQRNGSSGKVAVAVIGTGEMGSATSKRLVERGAVVKTSVKGRSAASRERIAKLGIPAVEDDAALIDGADFVLSIIPPGEAVAVAKQFVPVLRAACASSRLKKKTIFIDCNAISPQTADQVAEIVRSSGAEYVDGGIIGTPPRDGYDGPLYVVSGPLASRALELRDVGLNVRHVGESIGAASALKMSYAGCTKGFTAVATTMFTAAARHGVDAELVRALVETNPGLYGAASTVIPRMPPKAYRWIAEMREIRDYVAPDGLGDEIYEAVARLYEKIEKKLEAEGMGEGTQLGRLRDSVKQKVASGTG